MLKKNIEIIKNMIEVYQECSVEGEDMQVDITFREEQCKALQELLQELENKQKRIYELEKNTRKMVNDCFNCPKGNTILTTAIETTQQLLPPITPDTLISDMMKEINDSITKQLAVDSLKLFNKGNTSGLMNRNMMQ